MFLYYFILVQLAYNTLMQTQYYTNLFYNFLHLNNSGHSFDIITKNCRQIQQMGKPNVNPKSFRLYAFPELITQFLKVIIVIIVFIRI